jgi:hypothetical protein
MGRNFYSLAPAFTCSSIHALPRGTSAQFGHPTSYTHPPTPSQMGGGQSTLTNHCILFISRPILFLTRPKTPRISRQHTKATSPCQVSHPAVHPASICNTQPHNHHTIWHNGKRQPPAIFQDCTPGYSPRGPWSWGRLSAALENPLRCRFVPFSCSI